MPLSIAILFSAVCAVALAACAAPAPATPGPATPPAVTPDTTPPQPAVTPPGEAVACAPSGADEQVAAVDFAFSPAQVTVSVGQTIQWTNNGQAPHTVTFDGGPDCGTINSGESVSATFGTAGTYSYICRIHPAMTGTVEVTP